MKIPKWTTRDFTLVGVIAALCIVFGIVVKVFLGPVIGKIPGASQTIISMLQAIILTLGIMKLPKTGFLTLLGTVIGTLYGFIFPGQLFLFGAFVVAGLVGDIIGVMLGSFPRRFAIGGAVTSFRLTVIFLGMVLASWLGYSDTDLAWSLMLVGATGSAIGAITGTILGLRLSRELQKAGVLSPIGGA